jgi:hypothetical protein
MRAVLSALHETGFRGPMRPDHGRMIWGETGRPGYGLYDRALGATYLVAHPGATLGADVAHERMPEPGPLAGVSPPFVIEGPARHRVLGTSLSRTRCSPITMIT